MMDISPFRPDGQTDRKSPRLLFFPKGKQTRFSLSMDGVDVYSDRKTDIQAGKCGMVVDEKVGHSQRSHRFPPLSPPILFGLQGCRPRTPDPSSLKIEPTIPKHGTRSHHDKVDLEADSRTSFASLKGPDPTAETEPDPELLLLP